MYLQNNGNPKLAQVGRAVPPEPVRIRECGGVSPPYRDGEGRSPFDGIDCREDLSGPIVLVRQLCLFNLRTAIQARLVAICRDSRIALASMNRREEGAPP